MVIIFFLSYSESYFNIQKKNNKLKKNKEGIHEYPFPFEYFQNVVTQSDVFAIIVNYTYAIPDTKKLSLSLSQLGFKPKKIECCRSTLSTSDALLQMYNHCNFFLNQKKNFFLELISFIH